MWDYRLLFEDGWVSVVECYYDDNGKPSCYCEACTSVFDEGDTAKLIAKRLRGMILATKKPILNVDNFTFNSNST